MLRALWQGKLVPPEIQEDRYFLYRIPELLQSWVDWSPRPAELPALPWQGEPFRKSWPGARFHVRKVGTTFAVVNMAKGGVLKIFRTDEPKTVVSDAGVIAATADGKVITTQWIDPEYAVREQEETIEVEGRFHFMVMSLFTPWTMIAFRLFMLCLGWHTGLAYKIKGWIRRRLMTKSGGAAARFRRTVRFDGEGASMRISITDRIERNDGPAFTKVKIGDDFSVRYVPQSRYFQRFELGVSGSYLSQSDLDRLNREGSVEIMRTFDSTRGLVGFDGGGAD
jgi:hypothetical protein